MTNDFIAYWAAARLLSNHGNGYAPAQVLELQRVVDPSLSLPAMMYNPPWTLIFVVPFGWLDYDTAQLCWFVLHTVMLFLAAQLLWRHYGTSPTLPWSAWLGLLSFAPIYFVLLIGQIGTLVLAGVVGFLLAMRQGAYFFAGAALAIAAIKPHLLHLLWLAVLLWSWRQRRWQVAAGFLTVFAVMAVLPLLLDGEIYVRYFWLMSEREVVLPMDWLNPTIGMAINRLLGTNHLWLRWLPLAAGTIWFIDYWRRHGTAWDWSQHLPGCLLVSVVSAPYSWTFDYVVLLPALIQGILWHGALRRPQVRFWSASVYFACAAAALGGKFIVRDDFWYFWLAPVMSLLYLWLRYAASGDRARE